MAKLQFLGATGQVTGSCYLLNTADGAVLLECGLFQGDARTEALNERPFSFSPSGLHAVVLSHAHLDHCGLLPRLVREGFRGPVYATPATLSLAALMLRDAAHLMQKDTEWENKLRQRAGREPAVPLYTQEDVEAALALGRPVEYGAPVRLSEHVEATFHDAGHILGSSIVELGIRDGSRRIRLVFSGDLGNRDSFLLPPAARVDGADVLLMESTYGDRDHRPPEQTLEELAQALAAAHRSGGNVLIPSFAVGRTQDLLYVLGRLYREGRLPQRAVFLDSPMAIAATEIYQQYTGGLAIAPEARNLHHWLPVLRLSRTQEDSMAINKIGGGAVIIAGSGMCTGGRIRHHLKYNLWRPAAHVIIVGYQARGTPGRALVDGARQVHLLGNEIAVRATIHTLGGFSAHAGQTQLIDWLEGFERPRPRVYLVHGEPEKSQALAEAIARKTGRAAALPREREVIEL
jgi:metallo-beta-lactamase family protein